VILNHLLNYRSIQLHWDKQVDFELTEEWFSSIQQVDFEPPAEGITGAAVGVVCGGLRLWGGQPPVAHIFVS
jgi:hypothetical protein